MGEENALNLPEHTSDSWMGGTRHRFQFCGHEAWLVEPPDPFPERRWFAVPEWTHAYPERNGVKDLLALGYYMVHVHLMGYYANAEAVSVMYSFYQWLRERNFAAKGAFIGMSLGGLYSFRFAEEHPECAACIYADAPACTFDYGIYPDHMSPRVEGFMKAYGVSSPEGLKDHPLAPVNRYSAMARAGIPVLMILGLADTVLDHKRNGSLFAERYAAAGGKIKVIGREQWGHHPHGLDHTEPIVNFILRNTGA